MNLSLGGIVCDGRALNRVLKVKEIGYAQSSYCLPGVEVILIDPRIRSYKSTKRNSFTQISVECEDQIGIGFSHFTNQRFVRGLPNGTVRLAFFSPVEIIIGEHTACEIKPVGKLVR